MKMQKKLVLYIPTYLKNNNNNNVVTPSRPKRSRRNVERGTITMSISTTLLMTTTALTPFKLQTKIAKRNRRLEATIIHLRAPNLLRMVRIGNTITTMYRIPVTIDEKMIIITWIHSSAERYASSMRCIRKTTFFSSQIELEITHDIRRGH